MPFCPNCGSKTGEVDKFCRSCGNGVSSFPQVQLSSLPQQDVVDADVEEQSFDEEPIVSQTVADTSRLSRAGIEKFLDSGERLVYATPKRVIFWAKSRDSRFAYVTNKRLLFYAKVGALIKKDKLDEIFLKQIRKLRLEEKGNLLKKRLVLEVAEWNVIGARGDLLDLYKAIQSARG